GGPDPIARPGRAGGRRVLRPVGHAPRGEGGGGGALGDPKGRPAERVRPSHATGRRLVPDKTAGTEGCDRSRRACRAQFVGVTPDRIVRPTRGVRATRAVGATASVGATRDRARSKPPEPSLPQAG